MAHEPGGNREPAWLSATALIGGIRALLGGRLVMRVRPDHETAAVAGMQPSGPPPSQAIGSRRPATSPSQTARAMRSTASFASDRLDRVTRR